MLRTLISPLLSRLIPNSAERRWRTWVNQVPRTYSDLVEILNTSDNPDMLERAWHTLLASVNRHVPGYYWPNRSHKISPREAAMVGSEPIVNFARLMALPIAPRLLKIACSMRILTQTFSAFEMRDSVFIEDYCLVIIELLAHLPNRRDTVEPIVDLLDLDRFGHEDGVDNGSGRIYSYALYHPTLPANYRWLIEERVRLTIRTELADYRAHLGRLRNAQRNPLACYRRAIVTWLHSPSLVGDAEFLGGQVDFLLKLEPDKPNHLFEAWAIPTIYELLPTTGTDIRYRFTRYVALSNLTFNFTFSDHKAWAVVRQMLENYGRRDGDLKVALEKLLEGHNRSAQRGSQWGAQSI